MGNHGGTDTRQVVVFCPSIRLPELRARDAFGAMNEGAFNMNDNGKGRSLAVDLHGFPERLIANDAGFAADPQGFACARHKEKQADTWVAQKIAKRVDATVARTIGDSQMMVIQNLHKPCRITLG